MTDIFAAGGDGLGIYIDNVNGGGFERAQKALAGIPNGARKAINSAVLRATSSGTMLAQKELRQEYILPAAAFKGYTQTKRHYISGGNGTTVAIEYRGYHIPLMQFDVGVSRSGGVSARVKRSNARIALDSAFMATMAHGAGVFERTGAARFPVRGLYGPSVPQMLSYNESLTERVMKQIGDKFEERIDHEILRLLNGWGG